MKVAIECKSPLLQKSLEIFLDKYLSIVNRCDIVVREEKCLDDKKSFYIGRDKDADLVKPFSKAQLILALEQKYETLKLDATTSKKSEKRKNRVPKEEMDFSLLEKRIERLTQEYQQNILRTVKAFYEK